MRAFSIPVLLAALAAVAQAQSLEEKLEQKLASPFAQNAPWVLDYEQALAQAKTANKLVFAYFSRSFAP